jgi:hypothetical protein
MFEELDGPLMAFGGLSAAERAQVPRFARTRVALARIQAIFAGFGLPDHIAFPPLIS